MEGGPRLHILYDFVEGPWGGGNQFLKALRNQLETRDLLAPDPQRAEIVLVNSHHRLPEAARLKWRDPRKTVIHRIDGPVNLVRGRDLEVDRTIYRFSGSVADGTVFQSNWSRDANLAGGLRPRGETTVILNAPDPAIFHPGPHQGLDASGPVRLVATSWSGNSRKGFDIYSGFDQQLDFERYAMTFIGNTAVPFTKIRLIDPLPSAELGEELRRHHVFITASRSDPCSNSLLEALHTSLPALVLDDGGHPELVGHGGETFRGLPEALEKLDRIVERYDEHQRAISVPSISEVTDAYVDFAHSVHTRRKQRPAERSMSMVTAGAMAKTLETPLLRRALTAGVALSAWRSR